MAAQPPEDLRDRSLGDLVGKLSQETSTLVRQELALARAELSAQGRKAGAGAGLLGGAAAVGLVTLGLLAAFLVLLLAEAMTPWLAALIVTVVFAAVTAILAVGGRNRIRQATPPAPQTVETVKEDVQWAKNQTPSGGT